MLAVSSPDFGIKHDFEDDEIERNSNIGLFNKPAGTGFELILVFIQN